MKTEYDIADINRRLQGRVVMERTYNSLTRESAQRQFKISYVKETPAGYTIVGEGKVFEVDARIMNKMMRGEKASVKNGGKEVTWEV